jgi:hypothetical protein
MAQPIQQGDSGVGMIAQRWILLCLNHQVDIPIDVRLRLEDKNVTSGYGSMMSGHEQRRPSPHSVLQAM